MGFFFGTPSRDGYQNSTLNNWMFGGNATSGMPTQPQTADYQRGYLQNMLGQGPAVMNTAQSNQTRDQQGQLGQMLFNQANGTTPGAGEMAVQRQANNAMAQQTSGAQMARGADSAMALRNAGRANADIGVNAAGQAGIAQLNDRTAAQSQLGGLLGMQRGQDIQVAGANQQGQIAQGQQQLGALAQMLGVDQSALQQDLARRGINMNDKGMFPSLLQIGGQLGVAGLNSRGHGGGGQ